MNGRWTQFVALGDSLTEGIGDFDATGAPRGWADRFAEEIARRQGTLRYANLAVRGRLTADVLADQLGPALALAPDLVSVIVGMNDLIRPAVNLPRVCAQFDHLLVRVAGSGAVVLTATLPNPGSVVPLPAVLRRRFADRLGRFNDHVRGAAQRYGAVCADLADRAVRDIAGWSDDRLHPGPYGHQLVADEFLELLTGERSGVVVARPVIDVATEDRLREQLRWFVRSAGPWLWRRLRDRPEDRLLTAKFPVYQLLGATQG
ncbi:MAG TPA: SGNH/GDSL hydrolase family protein [Actinophytocola sp.]|uniref:SGNH/GDSL hydrolase family protein n=1 Tax=Actinophytocola sp. TaxID=1872138 RepID=UPI002DC06481|nr:SGNH/GDSL hydrolase family protein [Actinophytocola sp.]HEU5469920.1 SGNH/GDSL hydrolase family protein [Actinophytocola sp.]